MPSIAELLSASFRTSIRVEGRPWQAVCDDCSFSHGSVCIADGDGNVMKLYTVFRRSRRDNAIVGIERLSVPRQRLAYGFRKVVSVHTLSLNTKRLDAVY